MNAVIIVAGGSGKRMGSSTPKQFLLVAGKPILMHTVENFYRFDSSLKIILVLPEEHHTTWLSLCEEYNFTIPHDVAIGGSERFFSVRNGLQLVPADVEIIAVHDGVRPLTSHESLSRCFSVAAEKGTAIPVVPLVDSIRLISDKDTLQSISVPRSDYIAVQTPQCFAADLLHNAYDTSFSDKFTDDASVVESFLEMHKDDDVYKNIKISLVDGNIENIKITSPSDIVLAEYYLSKIQ